MEINRIGNNGYAAKGLNGIKGDSGKSIHFSAYDLSDSSDWEVAKKLIMSGKALSTNPDLQTPETYENGDTLLTVYGEFYTLKSLSSDNVEISSSTIAEFFPAMGEELEDDQLTFELTTVSNIDSAAGSKSTYYNTHRPSSDYYYNHNSSPFIKVQKNVGTSAPPVVWGNNISFTDKSVENLKKILNTPDEYKPYVKISLIFKCGLTKEIIYTKASEVENEIFIENEYIHMCGFMTCKGERYIVLNNQYLENTTNAEPYYTGLSEKLNNLKYSELSYSANGNNKEGSNYSYPLIFGRDVEGGTLDPKKAMCTAFVEYYKNGKLRTKKINIA